MPEITVNGVTLHHEELGKGEPILCIHGTGSSVELWRDAGAELAKLGRTVLYDRRGFGRSERPQPLLMDVGLHADDAAALLEALDASPAVVVGRSHGGEVALDLALRHPERVRALALLEGGGLMLSEGFRRWCDGLHQRLFAAAEADMATAGETFLRDVVGDEGWEALPAPVRATFAANGPAIVAEERGGLLDVTVEQLRTLAVPALVVAGRASPPEFGEAMELAAGAIPGAELVWIESGHLIDPAHPAVVRFVEQVLALR
ncbi:MAG TPA: alpha/beta hydrolase [Gaiellaceae bacterium]|nr:alpha/beta hydrolase [Gaiellaceae bacterium]